MLVRASGGARVIDQLPERPRHCAERPLARVIAERAALMAMPYVPIRKLNTPPRLAVCFTHHRSELSPEGMAAVQGVAVQLGKAGAAMEIAGEVDQNILEHQLHARRAIGEAAPLGSDEIDRRVGVARRPVQP